MKAGAARLATALIGLAIGIAGLAVAFRHTPPAAVFAVLEAGRWGLPAAWVLIGTAAFVGLKAARWWLLLGSPEKPRPLALLPPVLAGLALNALIPHSGEVIRALSLQRRAGRAASGVLFSIVAERVFDLFGVLILGTLALGFIPVAPGVAAMVRVLAMATLVLASLVVVAVAAPAPLIRFVATAVRALPARARDWLNRQLIVALAGLEPVRSPGTSIRVLLLSLVQWLAIALCVYGSAAVAGVSLSLAATCLVVVGIVVAFLLPNAPGYSGSVQVAFLVTLEPLGIPVEAALAASLVYQALMVGPTIVAGLALTRTSLKADASGS